MKKAKVTALVLSYNEEHHIEECLKSMQWCDEVFVVDSGSTDNTVNIAKRYTCNVVEHIFEGFAKQREWARTQLPIKNQWIIFIDCDERVTSELAEEIYNHTVGINNIDGYYIWRKQYFFGRWLKYGEAGKGYSLRLAKREKMVIGNREVHENLRVNGNTKLLEHPIIHISRENISEALVKLDKYASLEAQRMYRTGEELYTTNAKSFTWKNQVLKHIFKYLPGKPIAKYLYDYFIKLGFLDGYEGHAWAVCQGLYVFLSYFKLWELKRGNSTIVKEK